MDFRDVSMPSGGDRRRPHVRPSKLMRSKSRREQLMELVDKEVRHQPNAAEHRGHKDALAIATELTSYVQSALAVVQPYNPDGTPRPGGDKDEYWTWMDKLRDLLALRLPYERPRLSAIAVRDETPRDEGEYETIHELRARMVKRGLPVDHLIERKLLIDHEIADAGDAGGAA
jgi:hypothetical protein